MVRDLSLRSSARESNAHHHNNSNNLRCDRRAIFCKDDGNESEQNNNNNSNKGRPNLIRTTALHIITPKNSSSSSSSSSSKTTPPFISMLKKCVCFLRLLVALHRHDENGKIWQQQRSSAPYCCCRRRHHLPHNTSCISSPLINDPFPPCSSCSIATAAALAERRERVTTKTVRKTRAILMELFSAFIIVVVVVMGLLRFDVISTCSVHLCSLPPTSSFVVMAVAASTSSSPSLPQKNIVICTNNRQTASYFHLDFATRHDFPYSAIDGGGAVTSDDTFFSIADEMRAKYWPSLTISTAPVPIRPNMSVYETLGKETYFVPAVKPASAAEASSMLRQWVRQDGPRRCNIFIGPSVRGTVAAMRDFIGDALWIEPFIASEANARRILNMSSGSSSSSEGGDPTTATTSSTTNSGNSADGGARTDASNIDGGNDGNSDVPEDDGTPTALRMAQPIDVGLSQLITFLETMKWFRVTLLYSDEVEDMDLLVKTFEKLWSGRGRQHKVIHLMNANNPPTRMFIPYHMRLRNSNALLKNIMFRIRDTLAETRVVIVLSGHIASVTADMLNANGKTIFVYYGPSMCSTSPHSAGQSQVWRQFPNSFCFGPTHNETLLNKYMAAFHKVTTSTARYSPSSSSPPSSISKYLYPFGYVSKAATVDSQDNVEFSRTRFFMDHNAAVVDAAMYGLALIHKYRETYENVGGGGGGQQQLPSTSELADFAKRTAFTFNDGLMGPVRIERSGSRRSVPYGVWYSADADTPIIQIAQFDATKSTSSSSSLTTTAEPSASTASSSSLPLLGSGILAQTNIIVSSGSSKTVQQQQQQQEKRPFIKQGSTVAVGDDSAPTSWFFDPAGGSAPLTLVIGGMSYTFPLPDLTRDQVAAMSMSDLEAVWPIDRLDDARAYFDPEEETTVTEAATEPTNPPVEDNRLPLWIYLVPIAGALVLFGLGVLLIRCCFSDLCLELSYFLGIGGLDPMASLLPGEASARVAPRSEADPIAIIFTDIESSTALWAECPREMSAALDLHNRIVRQCIREWNGYEVKVIGDSFMIAFKSPSDALQCAVSIQHQLFKTDWSKCSEGDNANDEDDTHKRTGNNNKNKSVVGSGVMDPADDDSAYLKRSKAKRRSNKADGDDDGSDDVFKALQKKSKGPKIDAGTAINNFYVASIAAAERERQQQLDDNNNNNNNNNNKADAMHQHHEEQHNILSATSTSTNNTTTAADGMASGMVSSDEKRIRRVQIPLFNGLRVRIGGTFGNASIRRWVRDHFGGIRVLENEAEAEAFLEYHRRRNRRERGKATATANNKNKKSNTEDENNNTNTNGQLSSSSGDAALMKARLDEVEDENDVKMKKDEEKTSGVAADVDADADDFSLYEPVVNYDYFGHTVNIASRVESLGHGGQILFTQELVEAAHEEALLAVKKKQQQEEEAAAEKVKAIKEKDERNKKKATKDSVNSSPNKNSKLVTSSEESRRRDGEQRNQKQNRVAVLNNTLARSSPPPSSRAGDNGHATATDVSTAAAVAAAIQAAHEANMAAAQLQRAKMRQEMIRAANAAEAEADQNNAHRSPNYDHNANNDAFGVIDGGGDGVTAIFIPSSSSLLANASPVAPPAAPTPSAPAVGTLFPFPLSSAHGDGEKKKEDQQQRRQIIVDPFSNTLPPEEGSGGDGSGGIVLAGKRVPILLRPSDEKSRQGRKHKIYKTLLKESVKLKGFLLKEPQQQQQYDNAAVTNTNTNANNTANSNSDRLVLLQIDTSEFSERTFPPLRDRFIALPASAASAATTENETKGRGGGGAMMLVPNCVNGCDDDGAAAPRGDDDNSSQQHELLLFMGVSGGGGGGGGGIDAGTFTAAGTTAPATVCGSILNNSYHQQRSLRSMHLSRAGGGSMTASSRSYRYLSPHNGNKKGQEEEEETIESYYIGSEGLVSPQQIACLLQQVAARQKGGGGGLVDESHLRMTFFMIDILLSVLRRSEAVYVYRKLLGRWRIDPRRDGTGLFLLPSSVAAVAAAGCGGDGDGDYCRPPFPPLPPANNASSVSPALNAVMVQKALLASKIAPIAFRRLEKDTRALNEHLAYLHEQQQERDRLLQQQQRQRILELDFSDGDIENFFVNYKFKGQ